MKNKLALFLTTVSRIEPRHLQLALVVATLAMLVLGAGAPADGGPGTGK